MAVISVNVFFRFMLKSFTTMMMAVVNVTVLVGGWSILYFLERHRIACVASHERQSVNDHFSLWMTPFRSSSRSFLAASPSRSSFMLYCHRHST